MDCWDLQGKTAVALRCFGWACQSLGWALRSCAAIGMLARAPESRCCGPVFQGHSPPTEILLQTPRPVTTVPVLGARQGLAFTKIGAPCPCRPVHRKGSAAVNNLPRLPQTRCPGVRHGMPTGKRRAGGAFPTPPLRALSNTAPPGYASRVRGGDGLRACGLSGRSRAAVNGRA